MLENFFSKISNNSWFGKFPAFLCISLKGSFFIRKEFTKSLSLLIRIRFSEIEILFRKLSIDKFFSGSSKVCLQLNPFSFIYLEIFFAKFASIRKFIKKQYKYFWFAVRYSQKLDRLKYLLLRDLHNLPRFLRESFWIRADQASTQQDYGDFLW